MNIPPVAATQAGNASGGGFLASITGGAGAAGGAAGAPPAPGGPKADGSVGLFDGVLKKAAIGGAAGAVLGFLPFIPGGPILGGVVGALGGAALGVFKNYVSMKKIREENQAYLAAQGVQPQNAQQADALLNGQPKQLLNGGVGQAGQTGQTAPGGKIDAQTLAAAVQSGQVDEKTLVAAVQSGQIDQATVQQAIQILDGNAPRTGQTAQTGQSAQAAAAAAAQVPSRGTPVILDPASQAQFDRAAAQQSPMPIQGAPSQAGAAPPVVVDQSTQPTAAGLAQVAPKQAELAAGGGGAAAEGATSAASAVDQALKHEERIMKIWSYSDAEGKEIIEKRLQARLEALEALVDQMKSQRVA